MADFEQAINFVLKNEGGLEENPNDPGGITNHGISLRFLKSIKPDASEEDIRNLTVNQAKTIYYDHFWVNLPCKDFHNQDLVNYIFDCVVLHGLGEAVKMVQRALWACFKQYKCVLEDGVMGQVTLSQMNLAGYLLIYPLMAERANFCRSIARNEVFLNGWCNRCYRK